MFGLFFTGSDQKRFCLSQKFKKIVNLHLSSQCRKQRSCSVELVKLEGSCSFKFPKSEIKDSFEYPDLESNCVNIFSENYQRIICISRRPLIENFMKVQSIVISDVTKFEPEIKIGVKIDVAFCCIGTSLSDVSKVIIFFFSPMFSSRLILKG